MTFDEWFSRVEQLNMELGSLGGLLAKDQPIVHDGYARGETPREFFDFLERTHDIRESEDADE